MDQNQRHKKAARIVGSIYKYLGLQDISHKSRMVSQKGVKWRGTKFHILELLVYHLVG